MPVQKYERKPLTIEVCVWNGNNNEELTTFAQGRIKWENGKPWFKLEKPNHYGYDLVLLYEDTSGVKKDSNGKMQAIYSFDFEDFNEIL